MLEDLVVVRNARRHEFRHAALDDLLRQLRVFQLVADGHAHAGTDQLRQVGIEGMMRKAGQLHKGGRAICAPRQDDTEDAGRLDGVLSEGLVKSPTRNNSSASGYFALMA